jgi:hypothetical protein
MDAVCTAARTHTCTCGLAAITQRPCKSDGPGWDRTSDLGIKSPGERAAVGCDKRKDAANSAGGPRNELQPEAVSGDEPVRAFVHALVVVRDNSLVRPSAKRDSASLGRECGTSFVEGSAR